MKNKYTKNIIRWIFLIGLFLNVNLSLAKEKWDIPEKKLNLIYSQLKSSKNKINSLVNLRLTQQSKIYKEYFKHYLVLGRKNFEEKKCLSSIYWYSKYLKEIKIPNKLDYMGIHKHIVICSFELTFKNKALESLKMYIKEFLTIDHGNEDELVELFASLFSFSKVKELTYKSDLKPIFSDISKLSVSGSTYLELSYIISNILYNNKEYDKALNIIELTKVKNANEKDQKISIKESFIRGLILAQKKEFLKAEQSLQSALEKSEETNPLKSYIKLSLARVYVNLNKLSLAEELYLELQNKLKMSTYELVFVYIDTKQWEKALLKSEEYLSYMTYNNQYYKLKEILPWLYLKAHKIEEAKKYLVDTTEKYKYFSQLLHPYLNNPVSKFNYESFAILEKEIVKWKPASLVSLKIMKLKEDLKRIDYQFIRVRREINSSADKISHADLSHLNPHLYKKYIQLVNNTHQVIIWAEDLVKVTNAILQAILRPEDKRDLEANEKRRSYISSSIGKQIDLYNLWKPNLLINQKHIQISSLWTSLRELRSKNIANIYLSNSNLMKQNRYKKQVYLDRKKIFKNLEADIYEILWNVSKLKILNQKNMIKQQPEYRILNQLALTIDSDKKLLKQYLNKYDSLNDRTTFEKILKSWELWDSIYLKVWSNFEEIEKIYSQNIDDIIFNIEENTKKMDQLEIKKLSFHKELKEISEANVFMIANYYQNILNDQIAHDLKVSSDIKWKEYDQLIDLEIKNDREFQDQRSRYKNYLIDLQNGIL